MCRHYDTTRREELPRARGGRSERQGACQLLRLVHAAPGAYVPGNERKAAAAHAALDALFGGAPANAGGADAGMRELSDLFRKRESG